MTPFCSPDRRVRRRHTSAAARTNSGEQSPAEEPVPERHPSPPSSPHRPDPHGEHHNAPSLLRSPERAMPTRRRRAPPPNETLAAAGPSALTRLDLGRWISIQRLPFIFFTESVRPNNRAPRRIPVRAQSRPSQQPRQPMVFWHFSRIILIRLFCRKAPAY